MFRRYLGPLSHSNPLQVMGTPAGLVMGRKPMTESSAKMRARILEAARTRFLEEGLDGSDAVIASLVGVSSMTLYLYYESRQDIVRHIVLEGFTSQMKRLTRFLYWCESENSPR